MSYFKKSLKILVVVSLVFTVSGVVLFAERGSKDEAVLNIICFAGYAEPAWVEPFEEKYDCTVNVTYAGTVEEHFTKVKAAPDEYHIVSNDSGRIRMYYDAGLIQAINTSKLSNYSKIGEFFREHSYAQEEKGKKFHVPITWGAQFLTINTAKIPKKILNKHMSADGKSVSYDILTDPDTQELTAFFDEPANIWSIAAIHIGLDKLGAKDPFNFPNESAWEAVSQRLLEWKRNARTFTVGMDSELGVLMNEDALVLLGGNDAPEAIPLEEAGLSDSFTVFPGTEGTICWIDGWVITKATSGASLDLAEKYIDYMIGDQGQAELADLVGFGIVNPAGASGSNPIIMAHSPWYGETIADFPVPLYIMLAEEDPGRRVSDWQKIKAMQ